MIDNISYHLFFDIDGTLTKDNYASELAYKETLSKLYNINQINTNWFSYNQDSDTGILDDILNKNGIILDNHKIHHFEETYYELYLYYKNKHPIIPIYGAKNYIDDLLLDDNYVVNIFTGGFPLVAKDKLRSIGIPDYLLVKSAYDGYSRDTILGLTEGCDYSTVCIFGDSISDIQIMNKYNTKMVGLLTHMTKSLFSHYGVKCTVNNFSIKNRRLINQYVNS